MSAPAIGATSTGFVVAYREIDSGAVTPRIVLISIDSSGGALKPEKPRLPNRCPNADETDGLGLVMNGDTGLIALAKPACGAKSALEVLAFGPSPDNASLSIPGKYYVSNSPGDVKVSLSPSRAVANRAGGPVVVFVEGGAARIAPIDPEKGVVSPSGTFGGKTGITDAWVAANEQVLALLAAGRTGPAPPPTDDAGTADSGDAPAIGAELRLLAIPSTTAVDAISADNKPRAPVTFPGSWGSLAVTQNRVVVLTEGTGPGSSVTYRVFEQGKDTENESAGYVVEGAGKVTAGDVAVDEKRAYFVALKTGAVALDVYKKTDAKLEPLRSIAFTRETRIPAISTVRDGRVAIALSEGRVAVAWTTAKILTGNDPAGGYAVFACTD
jgi:hypothetical protein